MHHVRSFEHETHIMNISNSADIVHYPLTPATVVCRQERGGSVGGDNVVPTKPGVSAEPSFLKALLNWQRDLQLFVLWSPEVTGPVHDMVTQSSAISATSLEHHHGSGFGLLCPTRMLLNGHFLAAFCQYPKAHCLIAFSVVP